ncbi:DUF4333 domain-containing protein [Lentzea sp. NBRC 105346]|uniref:DUF4333 domain-containing protein n=1 Tax=Lentzea sp. NBRC 105346 TaxID=3032205 RepID=UPI002553F0E8|nr:DUF4333 domain-containing protein [Lentzea sp. NBRC 105346]
MLAKLASLGVMSLLATGCASPTPGTPFPAPGTVTVMSAVTATPTAPSQRRVFVADAVERGVVKILRDEYKITNIGQATCPEGQAVEPGTTFICIVDVGGADKSVKVTVRSADGEYEVDQPR